jgi:hypothetical protein
VNTKVDKRVLVLERQHMSLRPEMIMEGIDQCRNLFPHLAGVEIWILETPFYDTSFGFRFERYQRGKMVEELDFYGEV